MARCQVRVTSWPGSLKAREVQPAQSFLSFSKALCVCQSQICSVSTIYCCLSSCTSIYAPACRRQHLNKNKMRAKADHVIDCVFLPTHAISRAGIHTVCAWSAGEWSMQSRLSRGPAVRIVSGYHCIHFAPGGFSSRREPSPTFLAVLAVLAAFVGFAVGSVGGNGDGRVPISFLTCQIHCLLSRIGNPFCGFFPSETGLVASSIFRRGGRCGERWLFAHSHNMRSYWR